MHDPLMFGLLVLCVSAAGLMAVQSHTLSERLRVPAPAFFLIAAACAVRFLPALAEPSGRTVERVVTVALIVILFDGGMGLGLGRMRTAGPVVLSLGVAGTFATAAAAALLVHLLLGVSWYLAALVATAVAPTDPAVVFSVLGQREVQGRSGAILEGESGANDPVGIALMAALLRAGSLSGGALWQVAGTFALQMAVGTAVGVAGGRLLLVVMRRVPVPGEGLYPVRTLVAAGLLFGIATVAHGSGFLAVFLAGIVIGDERAPFKREIERFHSALASLAEVVAFAYLGFTVHLDVLARTGVWLPGVLLGVLLAVVVRPVVGLPLLLAGLKGAVPLLLGSMMLPLSGGDRLYGVVVVVVLVSVIGQGTLVPAVARWLHVGMRPVEPAPFSAGLRLSQDPAGQRRLTVAAGSAAEGTRIDALPGLAEGTWVAMLARDGGLVRVLAGTQLRAGDQVLLLVGPLQDNAALEAVFTDPGMTTADR